MPGTARFMSWNIANYSAKKTTPHFSEYVTQTVLSCNADFLGILEVVTFIGESLGDEIAGRLLNFDKWVYQDSDQFVAHSEQYVRMWKTGSMKEKKQVTDFGGIEFPDSSFRPPFIGIYDIGTVKNMPIGLYHAPGPQQKAKVQAGCANLAKIKELASGGLLMGDFNVSPSDFKKDPGKKAFGGLATLGYTQGMTNKSTSLKTVAKVANDAKVEDCLSSEYDNAFYKMTGAYGTVKCEVVNLFTPAVGDKSLSTFDEAYAARFCEYYGSTTKGKGWTLKSFKTVKAAFQAYRETVSDHLPIMVTWTLP